ncbi:MAG: ribosome maturation factor RimM [Clostridiales bacterium]|jgi:16S rRNA processing protein RimM|nr:ribosome maturation factor RimM [Clostridiales bacterium]
MRVSIGLITKPHGVKGEVKIFPDTYDEVIFKKLKDIFINGKPYVLEYAKAAAGYIIAKLKGVEDIETAELLRNSRIEIDEKDRLKLPEGTHYIRDLIGCGVYAGEERIGDLIDVLQNGAADVYVVGGKDGEIMFPALKKLLKRVDTDNKIIVLDKKIFDETVVFN